MKKITVTSSKYPNIIKLTHNKELDKIHCFFLINIEKFNDYDDIGKSAWFKEGKWAFYSKELQKVNLEI